MFYDLHVCCEMVSIKISVDGPRVADEIVDVDGVEGSYRQ